MKTIAEIDGSKIQSEADFHREIALALSFGGHYGKNLNALWDVLSRDVERPISLLWKNASMSREAMPAEFDKIVGVLKDVAEQDLSFGAVDRFELIIQ